MKQCKGYRLVEPEDIDKATAWAKGLRPEDPEKRPEIDLLREILVTGMTYARVVAVNMGGLPSFDPTQTPEEYQAALIRAASMAKKPGGNPKKPGGKRGKK